MQVILRRGWPLVVASMVFGLGTAVSAQPPADEQEQTVVGDEQGPEEPPAEAPPAPAPVAQQAEVAQPSPGPSGTETDCQNGEDDDGDGMVDCADADCFGQAICEAGGNPERNDERCSDWIDNDGDGAVDCDDSDCSGPGITVCDGSFTGPGGQEHAGAVPGDDDLPELTGDMTVEDLIGNYGDNDGERNDYLCSDGIDNDQDGRVDCADFGCRFDAQVTVCQGSPGVRFSVVAGVGLFYLPEAPADETDWDVRFTRIQLRVLGQIPLIEDSFFILSSRFDKSPRLSFAHFQVPVGDAGHFAAVNSGSGSLTTGLIISASKHPLLDPPFYLFNAFEQGSGAAAEFGGPIDEANRLRFRLFANGGVGSFTGNVGGRFLPSGEENFAWGAGAQLIASPIGYYDRFDSPYLYTPSSMTLGVALGAKYDQQPTERYPWSNLQLRFEYDRFLLRAEGNAKYVIDYGGAWQWAWNVQTSVLIWPRTLMLAADVGSFYAQTFPDLTDEHDRPLDELQWRVALHWYWYRNIGLLSLLYREKRAEQDPERPDDPLNPEDDILEREVRLELQFRF